MNELSSTSTAQVPPDVVGRVVKDVTSWLEWVPGLSECGQPSPGEARGVWSGPVEVGFHFVLKESKESLTCEMVESDVPFIEVRVTWGACDEGTAVTVALALQLERTLPGVLWRELEQTALPALSEGLAERAAKVGA